MQLLSNHFFYPKHIFRRLRVIGCCILIRNHFKSLECVVNRGLIPSPPGISGVNTPLAKRFPCPVKYLRHLCENWWSLLGGSLWGPCVPSPPFTSSTLAPSLGCCKSSTFVSLFCCFWSNGPFSVHSEVRTLSSTSGGVRVLCGFATHDLQRAWVWGDSILETPQFMSTVPPPSSGLISLLPAF